MLGSSVTHAVFSTFYEDICLTSDLYVCVCVAVGKVQRRLPSWALASEGESLECPALG